MAQIRLKFVSDVNDILNASTIYKSANKCGNMKITYDRGRLSEQELIRTVEDAETFKSVVKSEMKVLALKKISLMYSIMMNVIAGTGWSINE